MMIVIDRSRSKMVLIFGFALLLVSRGALGDDSHTVSNGNSPNRPVIDPTKLSTQAAVAQPRNWLRSLTGEPITSLSDAEVIALIARSIKSDEAYIESLNQELESEKNPYTSASEFFDKYDQQLESLRSRLAEAQESDQQELAESLELEISELQPIHKLAKERFDLAIERRRLMVQMVPLIELRLAQSQIMVGIALGEFAFDPPAETTDSATVLDAENEQPETTVEPSSDPAAIFFPSAIAPKSTEVPQSSDTIRAKRQSSEEFVLAEAEVQRWERTLAEVHENVKLLESRLEFGGRALELERSVAENSRQILDNLEALRLWFSEQFQQRLLEGDSVADLEPIRQQLREFAELSNFSRDRSRQSIDRVASINTMRTHLLEALASRKMDIQLAETKLEQARLQQTRIQNPFHPRNLFRWFLDHGPAILVILIGMAILYFLIRVVGSRIVRLLTSHSCRGSEAERESRAKTLVSTFRQAGTLAVLVGGTLMILDEVGIPIVPLLGGAAVFGLAIAFGAQNLIKDFFQGFMILLENQYKLNDVVQIGNHTGSVEEMSLRTTALRALDGTLHFIPNGQIEAVSNLTHTWSRAMFDIPVAYCEDVDHVMDVIKQVFSELREDPKFKHLCLEDVTMLGVNDFADSAVEIRFFIKTIPLQQWTVRREALRRIKIRFDAEGIEIPFPHRTHYLRSADGGPLEEKLMAAFNGPKN